MTLNYTPRTVSRLPFCACGQRGQWYLLRSGRLPWRAPFCFACLAKARADGVRVVRVSRKAA